MLLKVRYKAYSKKQLNIIIFTCSFSGLSKVASLSRSSTSHCRFAPQLCPGSPWKRVWWSKSGRVLVGASFRQVAQLKQWATPLMTACLYLIVFPCHVVMAISMYISHSTSLTIFMYFSMKVHLVYFLDDRITVTHREDSSDSRL